MPKVTEEHRAAMRQRIQDATIAVIARKGLGGLTMADIITESGLSAGAIYGYHKGKEELVVDIAGHLMASRREEIDEIISRQPIPAPERAIPELLATMPTQWMEGGLLLQFWGAASTRPELMTAIHTMVGAIQDSLEDYLAAWLAQEGVADAKGRAHALAPAVTGLTQGYVLQASLPWRHSLEDYTESVRLLLTMALQGSACGSDAGTS